ncbi:MAG: hypothetical protein WBH85_14290 [Thermoanaerobaculia bacterium]
MSWLQDLYETDSEKPILVGGAAVELYTGGAYSTGDLDFVGNVPPAVAAALREAGFERRGRHWMHEAGEIFIEFPSSGLDSGEESVILEVEDQRVVVVDPEALIADRLAAWQVWKSAEDGVNAWLITRGRKLDLHRVDTLAEAKGVSAAARALAEVVGRWQDADPTREELVAWAETFPSG